MPGFDRTGPMGMGPMTGGGRGFCNPRGVGAGLRRYGFPRRDPYVYPRYGGVYGFDPFAMQVTREQELEFLKSEAQAMKAGLRELETRIGRLSMEKG